MELGQKHAVVVDETDAPISLDHDVAVLQVVVGDSQPSQACRWPTTPLGGYAPEGVRLVEPGTDEPAQQLAIDPFHLDYGVPVSTEADSMFDILEVDEGRREDVEQVAAQLAVAGLLVADLTSEASNGERSVSHRYGVDTGEGPGEDERRAALVEGYFPGFEFGALEAQSGVLDCLAEVSYPWPRHVPSPPDKPSKRPR